MSRFPGFLPGMIVGLGVGLVAVIVCVKFDKDAANPDGAGRADPAVPSPAPPLPCVEVTLARKIGGHSMSDIPPAPLPEEPDWDDLPWMRRLNDWAYDHPDIAPFSVLPLVWLMLAVPQVLGNLLGPWAMYASYGYEAFIYCATAFLKPRKFLRPFVVASVLLAVALAASAWVTLNSRFAAPATVPYSPPPRDFPAPTHNTAPDTFPPPGGNPAPGFPAPTHNLPPGFPPGQLPPPAPPRTWPTSFPPTEHK